LCLCQRYFEQVNGSSDTGSGVYSTGFCSATNTLRTVFSYLVLKRAAPTITFSDGTTFAVQSNNASANYAGSSGGITTYAAGTRTMWLALSTSSSSLNVGYAGLIINYTSSYIQISAEL
jgi:hypothetical protein